MNATADRLRFAPPATDGHARALVLAVLAHLVLVAALTLGVQWKRSAPTTSVEAELWSAVPKAAAPRLVEAPVAPPPPKPAPAPPPPSSKVAMASEADIALEREKQRLAQDALLAARRLEQAKLEKQKIAKEKLEQLKLEKLKLAQLQREKEKLTLEKKREQELKLAQQKTLADETRREQVALKAEQERQKAIKQAQLEKADAIEMERTRNEILTNLQGKAGAAGAATAKGTALKSSGGSSNYGSKIRDIMLDNHRLPVGDIKGNPTAVYLVDAAPDGTIVGFRLGKSSGNRDWDKSGLDALDKMKSKGIPLPRDVNGLVPTPLEIHFDPGARPAR